MGGIFKKGDKLNLKKSDLLNVEAFIYGKNKTPFIIFCYGTSEEVKHNIITNNKRGITRIYPICFNFDEDSLILNKIA